MPHNCFKCLLSSASIIMGVVTWNNIAQTAENGIEFIGTHYGIVFQNNLHQNDLTESEDFLTSKCNIELQNYYLRLKYDIAPYYQYYIDPYLKNYKSINSWIGRIYKIAENFTNLVERIEKGKSIFDDDILSIKFPRSYLMSLGDIITLNTHNGRDMNLHDLFNYLSSKLYMILINIMKEMENILVKQVKYKNMSNDEYTTVGNIINTKLLESFDEVMKIKEFWDVFILQNLFVTESKNVFTKDDLNVIWKSNSFNNLQKLNNYLKKELNADLKNNNK